MLKIYIGEMPKDITNFIPKSSVYFDNQYAPEWFEDSLVKEMVKDVDKSTVVSHLLVESPVLGPITVRELSGGVKTLILMLKDTEKIFDATSCGNNCAKWILKIAEQQDVTVNLQYMMNFGEGPYDILIMNNNQIVHSDKEFVSMYLSLREDIKGDREI